MKNTKRLSILTNEGVQTLYALPQFEKEMQVHYLALTPQEQRSMQSFHGISSQLYFALQLSYFKVKRLLFNIEFDQVQSDAKFLLERYFCRGSKQ